MIKEKMKPNVGQPASALIAKLGYPTREEQVAGHKAFAWSSGQVVEGTSYSCTLRAILDAQDVISAWDFQGNERGCEQYAMRLYQQ
jgi:hypothetical protein